MSEPTEPQTTVEQPEYVDLNEITDAEQLRAVLRNPEKFTSEKPEGGEPDTPETSETSEPAENPEGETPEGAEASEPAEEPAAAMSPNRVKVRIAHLSESQREVLKLVSKGASVPDAQAGVVAGLVAKGKSAEEAEAEVYGAARKAVKPAAAESARPVVSEKVSQKEAEIEGMKAQIKSLREEYRMDEADEIRDRLDDAKWELREMKAAQAQGAQAAESESQRAVAVSTAEAIALFPDAEREGSELFEAIADEVEDRRESDPGFFDNPRWPILLAAEKAALLGIPSTKHKGGANPPAGAKVPPKRQALVPASGTSGGQQGSKPTAPANPQAELEEAGNDPEKLTAWMRRYGQHEVGPGTMKARFIA